jgi:hypothetical protein
MPLDVSFEPVEDITDLLVTEEEVRDRAKAFIMFLLRRERSWSTAPPW